MHRASVTSDENEADPSDSAGHDAARKVRDRPEIAPHADARPLLSPELIASQQINNAGLLAAGLAHDLNNLLTVILGSAELARDTVPASSPAWHHLQMIERTVRRGGEMCRTLLGCACTDQCQFESVDANELMRDTVTLLQSSRLAFHRVRLDLAAGLPALQANPAQFRQIVLNLLANAAEACGPRGGRIRVSTTLAQVDVRAARRLRPAGVPAGQFVRLRVADDGCGMDDETQQQLFTPFFTRKAQGRGLGLASLLAITRAHGGGVRAFSERNRGSIFDVFLPLAAPATETPAGDTTPPEAGSSPDERLYGSVLLADDEEILLKSLKAFLTAQGLTIYTVGDGEAALARLAAQPKVDLVLMDLMMPKLGGLDALKVLRAGGDRVPVILMTGHAEVSASNQFEGLDPAALLVKPFSLVELMRVIGEFLPQRR